MEFENITYAINDIRAGQQIFAYLIEHGKVTHEDDPFLYDAYAEKFTVQQIVQSEGAANRCTIERLNSVIYLIPDEDNTFLGFSKADLKRELCKSAGTDKDYYLSQFVIITILLAFYDGEGASAKSRTTLRFGDFQNLISDGLSEGVARFDEEEQSRNGVAFTNMKETFEALKSEEGSRSKTTKEGFLKGILKFLEAQGLINYVEADEMITPTDKLDDLMNYDMLNNNNIKRVYRVFGELNNEQN